MSRCVVLTALCLIPAGTLPAAEHVWLFAGQSNMAGGKGMYEAALRPVVEGAGHEFTPLHLAWGGNKIEKWLDPAEKDYPRNWGETEKALREAVKRGAVVAGVQWYQGESNVPNATAYEDQLNELIARLRKTAASPRLPVLVVQLGTGTSASQHGDWSLGVLREAQRRVAEADDHVALVASTDCRLQDRVVHLARTDDGHGRVARRLADAARKLAYGEPNTGLGPRVARARFGDPERTVVVIEFEGIVGELSLEDDALGHFFASTRTTLPERLADAPDPREFAEQATDHLVPDGYTIDGGSIALRFPEPLPETAVVSWTATGHAALGRGRQWDVVFARLTDDTGHQAPAFAALLIAAFAGNPVKVPGASPLRPASDGTRPVAVNLFLAPAGGLAADEVAGWGEWRQSGWNPTARFTFPHLFDDRGHVTNVAAHSYIHFGRRGEPSNASPDERLRFAGQTRSADFRNLEPNTEYDLVLYTVVKGEKPAAWADVTVVHAQPPKKPGSKPGEVPLWKQRVVGDLSKANEHGWQRADERNGWRGNVLVLERIDSGPLGVVRCTIAAPRPSGPTHRIPP